MNCREAEACIHAEHDGALADDRSAALRAHLGTCAACRRLRAQLTDALDALRADAQNVRVPDAEREWQALRRQLRAAEPSRDRSRIAWFGVPLAAAAALVVAFFVTPKSGSDASSAAPTPLVAKQTVAPAAVAPANSTIVYVDDASGWTFVWSPADSG